MNQADDPQSDLSHWALHDRFRLYEAALLWVGVDPAGEFDYDALPAEYQTIKSALIKAFMDGQIQGEKATVWETVEIPDHPDARSDLRIVEDVDTGEPDWESSILYRDSLTLWAQSRGARPRFLERDLDLLNAQPEEDRRGMPYEAPTHIEPWLRLILMAYEEHWKNYDPEDPNQKSPSNPEVIKELKKRRVAGAPVPLDAAKVIARIIRPDNAPKGRRRDTEDEKYG